MAANHSRQTTAQIKNETPVIGLVLGGAGLAILAGSMVIFFATKPRQDDLPPAPVVQNPDPSPVFTPAPIVTAWWDNLPNSSLAGTAILLKRDLPQDQPLFDSLSDKAETVRLGGYQKLSAKLPDLIRDRQAKNLLAQFLIDCYALEPADNNVAPLRNWFINQIPQENAAFPPGYKYDDLDRSFWALDISLESLTHKAIRLERARLLAQELGKTFGFAIDPGAAPRELRSRAEKLLALRCYRNLAPTAARSVEDALAIRETLGKKVLPYLSPSFREKVDIEVAVQSFPSAMKVWPAYASLLRDCVNSEDPQIKLGIVALYEQADPELAARMNPFLASKWKEFADTKLNQAAKVKAVHKALGVTDPTDRQTLLEKLASETLASAKSPANKSYAVLQETARLSHASTLACALLQKGTALARFDQLIARVPEIDPGEPNVVGGKPKQPDDDPMKPAIDPKMPGNNPGVPGAQRTVLHGELKANSPKDLVRKACFCSVHPVQFKRGKTYIIDLVSDFDNYLRLENSKGFRLGEDDDSGGGLNARLIHSATFDDKYRVIATSNGAGSMGPYTLTIQETAGFGGGGLGGPAFGGAGFGGIVIGGGGFGFGNPFFPGMRPFPGRFPPGIMIPGQRPMIMPGQPQPPVVKPQAPDGTGPASVVDEADVKKLKENVAKTRINALQNITAKLQDDMTKNDMTPRHARAIAKYLLTIKAPTEIDQVVSSLAPAARSRNLMLALADQFDDTDVLQKSSEAIVSAIFGQPLHFSKDDWRLACRKQLLLQALDLTGKNIAAETAELIRDLYKEQAILLGMAAPPFQPMTRPTQVMERMIEHLATKLGKHVSGKEDKEYLDQVPRQLQVAQFIAQNDLEHTVMLQRVWIKVLSLHLEQQSPQRAKEMRQVQADLNERDRLAVNLMEQLRGGEEKILRLWGLALDLK